MFKKIVPVLVITTVLFAGCDIMDTNLDSEPKLRVQMQVNSAGTFAKQLMANQEASTLEINEVKLYVDELELDGTQGTEDFEMEDIIVNLPLDGSRFNLAENQVPAGFYDEFELEVERPDDDDDFVSDSDFRGDNGWYSIIVKGLYNGVEFTYQSTQDFEIETDLNPPLEIGENESAEMVIEIDVNSWFKDSSGMYMDPSDEANRSRIDGNIENSFEGYEDDDDDDKSENSEKAWAEAEFTNTGVDPDASGEA
ncbi:MAG: hypothetical protein R3283_05365, partial [Balneolaceae bacterium]|nr:hypothetical protein [Balneolaceae bacterium]